jgi:hypothetical protein
VCCTAAGCQPQLGQLLSAHLAAKDFSQGSTAAWQALLAELLCAGLPWALQLLAQLAAVHGLPDGEEASGPFQPAVASYVQRVLADAAGDEQRRLQLVGAAAEGLAAVAAAVTQLPTAPQLVAGVARTCCGLAEGVACSSSALGATQRAELVAAARPALLGALRSAAAVVAARGPSQELYSGLSSMPDACKGLVKEWPLQLLAELRPVLLPTTLLKRGMRERRSLPGREQAEQLAAGAMRQAITHGKPAKQARVEGPPSSELLQALLPYARSNPWLPKAAGRAVRLIAERWPGRLAQAAGEGQQGGVSLLQELVAADASFAALPDIFPGLWGQHPELLEPLLGLQQLPDSCLFDCQELWRLYKTSFRAYSSRGMGSSCGDALWAVLPPCW